MFIGDDFHHNGAFRLSYGFEYAYLTEASKENSDFDFDRYDTYDWYLALGPLSNVQSKVLKDKKLPTWKDFANAPELRRFWQRQAMTPVPHARDGADAQRRRLVGPGGFLRAAHDLPRAREARPANAQNFLVVGPWRHGGWSGGTGQKLGKIDFGSPTGEYYRQKIQAPFFAHYLKDKGTLSQPEATVFESGSNTWRTFDAWPPKRRESRERCTSTPAAGCRSIRRRPATARRSTAT